jgi:hypothetical protein
MISLFWFYLTVKELYCNCITAFFLLIVIIMFTFSSNSESRRYRRYPGHITSWTRLAPTYPVPRCLDVLPIPYHPFHVYLSRLLLNKPIIYNLPLPPRPLPAALARIRLDPAGA